MRRYGTVSPQGLNPNSLILDKIPQVSASLDSSLTKWDNGHNKSNYTLRVTIPFGLPCYDEESINNSQIALNAGPNASREFNKHKLLLLTPVFASDP